MTVQSCCETNSGVDRQFGALNHEQSMCVLRLYDEGKSLMTSYLITKQDFEMSAKIVLGEFWKEAYVQITDEVDESDPTAAEIQEIMSDGSTLSQLKTKLRTIDKQLKDLATRCSEIQLCPALVQPVLSKLPRELRDYIYDMLPTSDDIKRLDRAMSSASTNYDYRDQPTVHLPDLPMPIFANPGFFGTEFATEFALRYVRTLDAAEIDYRCVRAHLNREPFGSLHLSFKGVISCLNIAVCETPGVTLELFAETAWRDSLDSLLMLKDNRNIKIIIYLPTWIQYRPKLFEVLEVTRPFFCRLRRHSMDIKVLGYDFFNPIETDTEDIFSEQLNYYFDRTPEEWLDMKAREIKEIPDAKQRRACRGILRAMRMNLDFYNKQNHHNEVIQAA